jgi:hypothetical protein
VAVGLVAPFHNQSLTPPVSLTGAERSFGAAASRLIASIRLDFPEPFGPIRTFSEDKGIGSVSGPNERIFFRYNSRKTGSFIFVYSPSIHSYKMHGL